MRSMNCEELDAEILLLTITIAGLYKTHVEIQKSFYINDYKYVTKIKTDESNTRNIINISNRLNKLIQYRNKFFSEPIHNENKILLAKFSKLRHQLRWIQCNSSKKKRLQTEFENLRLQLENKYRKMILEGV